MDHTTTTNSTSTEDKLQLKIAIIGMFNMLIRSVEV